MLGEPPSIRSHEQSGASEGRSALIWPIPTPEEQVQFLRNMQRLLAEGHRKDPHFLQANLGGWDGPKPERHHDFIDVKDFPDCWRRKKITVEVEAKEVAVLKLLTDLKNGEPDATWFVYLLRCADGSLYTGISNDVPRRLEQHNAGTASRYTRSRLPAVLVYQEPQASRSLALKRELAIKALSRQAKEALIRSAELPVVIAYRGKLSRAWLDLDRSRRWAKCRDCRTCACMAKMVSQGSGARDLLAERLTAAANTATGRMWRSP